MGLKARIINSILILTLIAVLGAGASVLYLFWKDKWSSIRTHEMTQLRLARSHVENSLAQASMIALENVAYSKNLILAVADPCSPAARPVISQRHAPHLAELGLDAAHWIRDLAKSGLCTADASPATAAVVPTQISLSTPYLAVLLQTPTGSRLALIAMDDFLSQPDNTLFLIDRGGGFLWGGDDASYVQGALADSTLGQRDLQTHFERSSRSPEPILQETTLALLGGTSVNQSWVLTSLSYKPALMRGIYGAALQSIFLMAGLFFFCLFVGRRLASVVIRPMLELRDSAERISQGDFDVRFEGVKRNDEISAVKRAFNTMAGRIRELISEAKHAAHLEDELEVARNVQQMLLPKSQVSLTNHQIVAFTETASQCGGDWWGCTEVHFPERTPMLLLMVGDVEGHGTPSALITACARGASAMLDRWLEKDPYIVLDLPRLLGNLNRALYESAKGTLSMTFFVAVCDPVEEKMMVNNAGHPFPYLLSPDNKTVTTVRTRGTPLGVNADNAYDDVAIFPWEKGSKLFCYSDGLTECFEGDDLIFGRKELIHLLKDFKGANSQQLLSHVMQGRKKVVGPKFVPSDDVTVVSCLAMGGAT